MELINDNFVSNYYSAINKALNETKFFLENSEINNKNFIDLLISKTKSLKDKGQIFFFGNGASSSFSNHMALDWSKNGGIKATSISDSSILTALANDYDYDSIFLEFFKLYGNKESDIIVTTSSSGNSGNIISLLEYASENKIFTFSLSGLEPNNNSIKLSKLALHVPMKTYGIVECVHQIFHHLWLDRYMGIDELAMDHYQNMNSNNFTL